MSWIRQIGKTDDEKEASREWAAKQRMNKAMVFGYRAHGLGAGHKSLTKCVCSRSPKEPLRGNDPKPINKFRQMQRRNMLRAEARAA